MKKTLILAILAAATCAAFGEQTPPKSNPVPEAKDQALLSAGNRMALAQGTTWERSVDLYEKAKAAGERAGRAVQPTVTAVQKAAEKQAPMVIRRLADSEVAQQRFAQALLVGAGACLDAVAKGKGEPK